MLVIDDVLFTVDQRSNAEVNKTRVAVHLEDRSSNFDSGKSICYQEKERET
jgi:hypothetical protein